MEFEYLVAEKSGQKCFSRKLWNFSPRKFGFCYSKSKRKCLTHQEFCLHKDKKNNNNKRKRQGTITFVFGDELTDFSVHESGKLNSKGTLSAIINNLLFIRGKIAFKYMI